MPLWNDWYLQAMQLSFYLQAAKLSLCSSLALVSRMLSLCSSLALVSRIPVAELAKAFSEIAEGV